MDTPGKKKKRDPQRNRASQRRYRERENAAVDGIEQVRARNRQRYYERIDRLKATEQYEALKKIKCQEGLRRYQTMPEEQRNEVRRKNLVLQKGLEGQNDPREHLRGIPTTLECAAGGVAGREKANHGCRGVEGVAARQICQTGRIRTPSTMAMVGRATGPSLSPDVVATGLGRVRA